MQKIRLVNAEEKAKSFNTIVGEDTTGMVLWYDKRDCKGIILGDNGNEYLFSTGRHGHIGQYTSNYVIDESIDATVSKTRVKFNPVDYLACNIRKE